MQPQRHNQDTDATPAWEHARTQPQQGRGSYSPALPEGCGRGRRGHTSHVTAASGWAPLHTEQLWPLKCRHMNLQVGEYRETGTARCTLATPASTTPGLLVLENTGPRLSASQNASQATGWSPHTRTWNLSTWSTCPLGHTQVSAPLCGPGQRSADGTDSQTRYQTPRGQHEEPTVLKGRARTKPAPAPHLCPALKEPRALAALTPARRYFAS